MSRALKLIIFFLSLGSICGLSFLPSYAKGLSDSFKQGEGSKYNMYLEDGITREKVLVSLYIASSMENVVSIEMYFDGQQKMWQRFDIYQNEKDANKSLEVRKGYFYVPELKNPEILPEKNLLGTSDVLMSDFLLNKRSQIDALSKGSEIITVPAGKINALHMQKIYKDKIIDYWISDDVNPLGIVRLIQKSTNGKTSDNFDMDLVSVLKNVQAKINPDKAVPITAEGKRFLGIIDGDKK